MLTREVLLEALYSYTIAFFSERFGETFPGDDEDIDHIAALLWQLDQMGGIEMPVQQAIKLIDVPGYMKAYYYE